MKTILNYAIVACAIVLCSAAVTRAELPNLSSGTFQTPTPTGTLDPTIPKLPSGTTQTEVITCSDSYVSNGYLYDSRLSGFKISSNLNRSIGLSGDVDMRSSQTPVFLKGQFTSQLLGKKTDLINNQTTLVLLKGSYKLTMKLLGDPTTETHTLTRLVYRPQGKTIDIFLQTGSKPLLPIQVGGCRFKAGFLESLPEIP
jgi:hypothetical protein